MIPARNNSSLKPAEREVELYDLDKIFKRQTYDEQKQWLIDNTTLFAGDVSDEFKPSEGVDDLA